jgi:hypothetical protein
MAQLFSQIPEINESYAIIGENISPSKIKIKYTPSLKKIRFEIHYTNKDMVIYLEK